jgi:hypothetical protein
MAKKERLGSDPFKEGPLGWIQDTREEKADSKELKSQNSKELKPQSAKALKRQNAKVSKQQNVKAPEIKRKHTLYLTLKQSKKLRVYAAENEMPLSEVIEKLIDEHI